jgi:hypothetical protein
MAADISEPFLMKPKMPPAARTYNDVEKVKTATKTKIIIVRLTATLLSG